MKFIFDYVKKLIFGQNSHEFKTGDVIFLYSNRKSSQRTKAIIKIYGKKGFVVCDGSITSNNFSGRPGVRMLSRQYIKKFCKRSQKVTKKVWIGYMPLDEFSWIERKRLDE